MVSPKVIFKSLLVALFVIALVALPACGSTDEPAESTGTAEVTFDGSSYSDMGSGSLILEGTDGTQSSAATPTLIISKNAASSSISFVADGYESEPKTYFFVDGVLVAENNIPGKTEGALTVPQKSLTEGTHKVEAVQFSSDTIGGDVVTYKLAEFTVAYESAATQPTDSVQPDESAGSSGAAEGETEGGGAA